MSTLLYEQETHMLRRCFFEVQNEVGIGRHEEAYHRACKLWFEEHHVPVASKMPHQLLLRGDEAHTLFPDLVAWDAICIELKAAPRHLSHTELLQLFDYLKYRRARLGLLVNMGLDRVEIERVAYDPPDTELIEKWDSWTDSIDGTERALGLEIRDALRAVAAEHTTGYSDRGDNSVTAQACRLHHRGQFAWTKVHPTTTAPTAS